MGIGLCAGPPGNAPAVLEPLDGQLLQDLAQVR